MKTTEKSRSRTAVSRGAGQELTDVLELPDARDRVADPPRLEVRERELDQVPEELRASSTSIRLVVWERT